MFINELVLKNFRNYDKLSINFEKNYIIIYGDNAQGKTNIIESIYLCASGRSHRTPRDEELIRTGFDGYYVGLKVEKSDRTSTIEIEYEKKQKKKIKINEIPASKIGDLMGNLNAVIFSPEDLFIIKEGPAERRRFIDITISQLRPSYFYDLQQYAKILYQRNMLLKEIPSRKELMGTMDVWNSHLIKAGARIIKTRREFIANLNSKASIRHKMLTNNSEEMAIVYAPSFEIDDSMGLTDIEAAFERIIEKSISKELQKCNTLFGPQRDEYNIMINRMNTKMFGSQGQQRTSILSMKLSEIDIMKEDTGEYPVLLLDDVLSELDSKRQEYLFESIGNIQTFITCTDKSFYSKSDINARYINVVGGKIIQ